MKKENIFTHKILPILSILILVSFIFISNNAFASSDTFTVQYNGETIEFSTISTIDFTNYTQYDSNCDYFILLKGNEYILSILPKNCDKKVLRYGSSTSGINIEGDNTQILFFKASIDNSTVWAYWGQNKYVDGCNNDFIYSTVDIYDYYNQDTIFFKNLLFWQWNSRRWRQ